jgi:hypothetical protein
MGGACSRLWSSTPRATEAPTARAEPAYLAAATWNRSDGFVDLGSTIGLNLSLARPIRIPNSSWYAAAVANMRHGSEQVILRAIQGVARKQCGTRAHLGRGVGVHRGSLFVDSGSNEGGWSLLAAAHGCDVLSIDPQQRCLELLGAAANRSGLDTRIQLLNRVLAPRENATARSAKLREFSAKAHFVPGGQCHGSASFLPHGRVSDSTPTGRTFLPRGANVRNSGAVQSVDKC